MYTANRWINGYGKRTTERVLNPYSLNWGMHFGHGSQAVSTQCDRTYIQPQISETNLSNFFLGSSQWKSVRHECSFSQILLHTFLFSTVMGTSTHCLTSFSPFSSSRTRESITTQLHHQSSGSTAKTSSSLYQT